MDEQKKPQRQMRYVDSELQIIKNTFAENDDLLKAIRKVMLQMPLNALDLSRLELIKKEGILQVLRKTFLPTLDPEAPLNQVIDLWMTIQIMDKDPINALPHLRAREKLIKYIDQQLKVLEGSDRQKIKFNKMTDIKGKSPENIYSDLITRNTMINHTEQQLNMLKVLAGLKDETLEQTQERLKKDSSK